MATQRELAEHIFEVALAPDREQLLVAALELPPEKRAAVLDDACRDTPELSRLVDELLADYERAGSFLGRPLKGVIDE